MLLDRRACLRLAASVLPFALPNASPAAGTIAFTSPELQYLEPIYELKFSLDALRAAVETPTPERITALRGRLKKFFGGPAQRAVRLPRSLRRVPGPITRAAGAGRLRRRGQAGALVACDDIIGGMRSLKDASTSSRPIRPRSRRAPMWR